MRRISVCIRRSAAMGFLQIAYTPLRSLTWTVAIWMLATRTMPATIARGESHLFP